MTSLSNAVLALLSHSCKAVTKGDQRAPSPPSLPLSLYHSSLLS